MSQKSAWHDDKNKGSTNSPACSSVDIKKIPTGCIPLDEMSTVTWSGSWWSISLCKVCANSIPLMLSLSLFLCNSPWLQMRTALQEWAEQRIKLNLHSLSMVDERKQQIPILQWETCWVTPSSSPLPGNTTYIRIYNWVISFPSIYWIVATTGTLHTILTV